MHQVHEDALDPDGTVHTVVDDLEIWHNDKMELLLFKTHLIQAVLDDPTLDGGDEKQRC
jgi:hypothetical protein